MSFVRDVVKDAAIGVGVASKLEDLRAIHHSGCAAVIWRRALLDSFQDWLNALGPEELPKARMILRPDAVRNAVKEICQTTGTPESVERDRLIDDVAALSAQFADVMQATWVRLRLDVVATNACRRFHIDAVTARLVCTYRGTGTQYGISPDGEDPNRVFTVPTGSPILLRGTCWPKTPKSGLLHRSPPIEGTGETRLLLVLDPIVDPADEPDPVLFH